jgi:N-acetylglucosamine kinase-like BadF-type ATPase
VDLGGDLVLGVDGGGTKTMVALADRSGRIVRTARAGGSNPLDNPAWRSELEGAVAPVVSTPRVIAAVAALPSYGEVEAVSAAQTEAAASVLGALPHSILNDVDAAQIGAFAGHQGILLLSGTGSMIWARDSEGRSHRVGGWGEIAGDEGSGFWIGQRILGEVTQSIDGRAPPTAMVGALFADLNLDFSDPADAIQGWLSGLGHQRSAIAALAPIAMRLAETGDVAARAIIDAAAEQLSRHVRAIEHILGPDAPWSYAGGTFKSPVLLAAVIERIGRPPVPPRLPPIGGALLAAARLADWSTEDAWVEGLQASLQTLPSDQSALQQITT